jgi:hypothetical protein
MAHWKVTVLDEEAAKEVASYFADENIKHEVTRILKRLSEQPDPRRVATASGLIVNRIEHDAPTWYRVKVGRYAIRVIFRILIVEDEIIRELGVFDPILDDLERYLDVVRIGRHPTVYGKPLRERYRKLK